MGRAMLYYTIGYPGSGKSTFARRFARCKQACYLSADVIGCELYGRPTFSVSERAVVLEEMKRRAIEAMGAGQDVIYDLCSHTVELRNRYREIAKQFSSIAVGIWMITSPAVAMHRAMRLRPEPEQQVIRKVTPEQFGTFLATFEVPAEEAYIVSVNGTDDFDVQLAVTEEQLMLGIAV